MKVGESYYFKLFVLIIADLALLLSLINEFASTTFLFEAVLYLVFALSAFFILHFYKEDYEASNLLALMFFTFSFINALYIYFKLLSSVAFILVLVNIIALLYSLNKPQKTRKVKLMKKEEAKIETERVIEDKDDEDIIIEEIKPVDVEAEKKAYQQLKKRKQKKR